MFVGFLLYYKKSFVCLYKCLLAFLCITKKGAGSANVIRQLALGTYTNCFPTTTTPWKNNVRVTYDCVITTSFLFPLWSFFRSVSVDKSRIEANDNVFDPR